MEPRTLPITLRRDLLDRGWNDRAILRMVQSGQWVRVRHGAYCERRPFERLDAPGKHLVRTRAVLEQARTDLVVSHASALPWYSVPIWGQHLDDVSVTRVDQKIGRHEAGVQQHRGRLMPDDVECHGLVRVVSPTRLALEVITVSSTEAALVVVDNLLHRGLTDVKRLTTRYRAAGYEIERWPSTLGANVVLTHADHRRESVGESRTAYLLASYNLAPTEIQLDICDHRGKIVARVDFAWPELGVFLEFDGKVKYQKPLREGQNATDVVVAEKRREELVCRLTGWRCLRLTWADLERPLATVAMVRAFLYSRPSVA